MHTKQNILSSSMIADQIKALPVSEKLQIMETIWEDFRARYDDMDISPEMGALLDQRRQRVRSGQSHLVDWDAVKHQIGKK